MGAKRGPENGDEGFGRCRRIDDVGCYTTASILSNVPMLDPGERSLTAGSVLLVISAFVCEPFTGQEIKNTNGVPKYEELKNRIIRT